MGEDLEETYSDSPSYTVTLEKEADDAIELKEYELNQSFRQSIQERAAREYEENYRFSCWWRVATESDEEDESTIHQEGDPILVIETAGRMVPWENLDQLQLEDEDISSFQEFDSGSGDVKDSGNGMQTVDPSAVDDDSTKREKSRAHFAVTPQDFEEMPSPEGEKPDSIPADPRSFDNPKMVLWMPEHPDLEHTWAAGRAIVEVDSWFEWNVQKRADQPRLINEKETSHDHFESLLKMEDCELINEKSIDKSSTTKDKSGSAKRKGSEFKDGKFGGSNWQI